MIAYRINPRHQVLMLIASEGYGFAPASLGGNAALSRKEMGPLSKIIVPPWSQ